MIVHIVIDHFFIDQAYKMFESASNEATEYIIIDSARELKKIKKCPVVFYSKEEAFSENFTRKLSSAKAVFLHWLDPVKVELVNYTARVNVNFVWIGWGGDYYDILHNRLLLNETKDFAHKGPIAEKFKALIKNLRKGVFTFDYELYLKKKSLKNIKYFCPVLESEFVQLRHKLNLKNLKFGSWNYGTLEDDLLHGFMQERVSGKNILVGNSATATNNHLEVFRTLSHIHMEVSIISPLSYGDPEYGQYISKVGMETFGESFQPIFDFLPLSEYLALIKTCGFCVMNHVRQQGLGNIVILLHMGAKIFLNVKNPIYNFLKENGVIVFSIEEIGTDGAFQDLLTEEQIQHNRDFVVKRWGKDYALLRTKNLIEKVCGKGF